jgi:hypothetical protein
VKALVLLGLAACVYLLASWSVAPGFYDCCTYAPVYNWVCPPPGLVAGNLPPKSGHVDIKVLGGVSDSGSAITGDGQIAVGFVPGAFDSAGKSTISVDITPVSPCPRPADLTFATNAYLVTATAQLVKNANLTLDFSGSVPAPSVVYLASTSDGPWTSIGAASTAQPYTINTATRQLGYFAAGYRANAIGSGGASQLLPIAVAVLIIGVLVAGIPLAIMRRRRAAGGEEESEETDVC